MQPIHEVSPLEGSGAMSLGTGLALIAWAEMEGLQLRDVQPQTRCRREL